MLPSGFGAFLHLPLSRRGPLTALMCALCLLCVCISLVLAFLFLVCFFVVFLFVADTTLHRYNGEKYLLLTTLGISYFSLLLQDRAPPHAVYLFIVSKSVET